MNKNLKGFTLVEVLIVIIIVGILIAALLPRLTGTQARARDTARRAHITQVAQGATLYLADNTTASVSGCVNATWAGSGSMTSLPTDPNGASAVSSDCTATEYAVYASSTAGTYIAVADVEGSGQGNCTVTEGGLATAITTPTLGTSGTHYCVLIQ